MPECLDLRNYNCFTVESKSDSVRKQQYEKALVVIPPIKLTSRNAFGCGRQRVVNACQIMVITRKSDGED